MNFQDFNTNYIIIPFSLLFLLLIILTVFFKRANRKHRYNRKKSQQILMKINGFEFDGQRINYLRKINPFIFEELILDAFQINGYSIKRNDRYTGDNGIDGVVCKDGVKFLIQAKRYNKHIKLKHVKDFNELTIKKNCKGFFIHTGRTGKGTWAEGRNMNNVSIISGSKLLKLINTLNTRNDKDEK